MTDEILIRFSVKDDGSPVIERVNKKLGETKKQSESLVPGLESAGKGLATFAGNNTVLLGTLAAVGVALNKSFNEYQKYAAEVRDVALASGEGAEEASRFLQVLDDYQISAQDVTAATKAMKEQGLVPTIDTLAKVAEGYQAIEDPAKKLQFAQDNLGRASAKFLNVLQQSPDALREQAAAISDNLILTNDQIAKSEEARLAIDALNDSIQGIKVQTGAWIGTQIIANKSVQDYAKEWKSLTGELASVKGGHGALTDEFKAFMGQMERGKAMTAFYSQGIKEIGDSAGITEEQLKELSKANAALINDAIAITDSNRAYKESQDEIMAQIGELQAKKGELFEWETDKRNELDEQIAELQGQYAEDADAFEQASIRKLTMMSLEKIALLDGVAGYSEAEAAKANALLETAGVAEASAIRQALAFDMASSAIANGTLKAAELDRALRLMESGYTIDVVLKTIANLAQGAQAMSGGGSMMAAPSYNPSNGYADGGISTGPATGHPEMLHGTEAVIPLKNGSIPVEMKGGSGGGDYAQMMIMMMAMFQALPEQIARANRSVFEKVGR